MIFRIGSRPPYRDGPPGAPVSQFLDLPPHYGYMVRGNYRRLRQYGLSIQAARSVIVDLYMAGRISHR